MLGRRPAPTGRSEAMNEPRKGCPFCVDLRCNCKSVDHVWEHRLESCGYCTEYNDHECLLTTDCYRNVIIAAEVKIKELAADLATEREALREICSIVKANVDSWKDNSEVIHNIETKSELHIKAAAHIERLKGV